MPLAVAQQIAASSGDAQILEIELSSGWVCGHNGLVEIDQVRVVRPRTLCGTDAVRIVAG